MITQSMHEQRSRRRRPTMVLSLFMAPLCSCAAGSSASITQAPLLFAEQAAPVVEPTSDLSLVSATTPSSARIDLQTQGQDYIAIGGNARLPITALVSVDGQIERFQIAPAPLAGLTQTLTAPIAGISKGTSAPLTAVSDALTTPRATVSLIPASPLAPVTQLLAGPVGSAANAVATVPSGLANGLSPTAAPVLQSPNSVSAVVTLVTGAVSAALVTTQPILTGAITQPLTSPGSNLLTVSASNLVRICLLKGCR